MTTEESQRLAVARFGFWAALGTGVMTLVSFGIAILTPPLSGQLCREGCLGYPYLNIANRFPRDYYWMFPAVVANLLYVAMMIGLYGRAAGEKRTIAMFGVALSVMAAIMLVGDYFVQLAVIQPSVLAGEADGISLLTQYNPHGLFIAIEELGYLLMSLSLACMAPAISTSTRLERFVRWLFVGGFIVNGMALTGIALRFGHARGYLFEIAVISVDWLVLVVAAFMLAAVFRRSLSCAASS
jgi:hypothetical protein